MRKLVDTAEEQEEDLTSRGDLKRARKTQEEALSRLARDLTALSERRLAAMELDESVMDAVREAKVMTSPRALQRQLRVVRSTLRDGEWPAIRARLDRLLQHGAPKRASASSDGAEQRWLVRLLGEGETALSELVEAHPNADRKHLRQLVRNVLGSTAPERKKRAESKLAATIKLLIGRG